MPIRLPHHRATAARLVPHAALALALGVSLCPLAGGVAHAADYRYALLTQNDWEANTGFDLHLEQSSAAAPVPLGGMKLVLGVANGSSWSWLTPTPKWVYGHDYNVRVVLAPTGTTMWLDDKVAGATKARLVPTLGAQTAQADGVLNWATGPAAFTVNQGALSVKVGGVPVVDRQFRAGLPGTLGLFAGEKQPESIPLQVHPDDTNEGGTNEGGTNEGDTIEVDTTFRIGAPPDPAAAIGIIDSYGQVASAQYPTKVKSDGDLKASYTQEAARLKAWGVPKGVDRYGGSLAPGWKEKPTGYYRVAKHGGFWWLITPSGLPCFYTGVCTVPDIQGGKSPITGREGLFQQLPDMPEALGTDIWGENQGVGYAGFVPWNLERKFGADWQTAATDLTVQRLRTWGFTGTGKWGDPAGFAGLPDVPVLSRGQVQNLVRRPDFLDPDVAAEFRSALAQQVGERVKDPFVVGWSLGNEYDEIVTSGEIRDIMAMPGAPASKVALVSYGIKSLYGGSSAALAKAWHTSGKTARDLASRPITVPDSNLNDLRRYYEDAYYGWVHNTIRSLDPNHLFIAAWVSIGWWAEEEDWDIAARHCDLVGYDRYSPATSDPAMEGRLARIDKPVLLGEFSFPSTYSGARGLATYPWASAADDSQSGALYAAQVKAAAQEPHTIGTLWFEYRDEPVTGRGPGSGPQLVCGEDFAFGMVDGTDQPKWGLIEQVREANLTLTGLRGQSAKSPK